MDTCKLEMEKSSLRTYLRLIEKESRGSVLRQEEERGLLAALQSFLYEGLERAYPPHLGLVYPLPHEVDTRSLWMKLVHWGYHLYLPLTLPGRRMTYVPLLPEEVPLLQRGELPEGFQRAWGKIPEGPRQRAMREGWAPHLVLVPGLAFDSEGYRLGMGGGYYDRYLARARTSRGEVAETFSLVPSWQAVDKVPHAEYDLPVKRLLRVTKLNVVQWENARR